MTASHVRPTCASPYRTRAKKGTVLLSIRVKKAIVWRTKVANKAGTTARAFEPLVEHDLDLVIGYNGRVIDVASISSKKAAAAAKRAGFEPYSKTVIQIEGENQPGVIFAVTRMLGEAGMSMDSLVAQKVGKTYQAHIGLYREADAAKAAALIRKFARTTAA